MKENLAGTCNLHER